MSAVTATVSVAPAPAIPTDLGAVGITFRGAGDRRACWLADGGYTTSRLVHATAWWPIRGGRPALGRAAFVAAQIARQFPGATVTVRPLSKGGRPLLTFVAS